MTMETMTADNIAIRPSSLVMTEEDFVEFCNEDTRAEFIAGEVIVHSPTSFQHSRIATFLTSILQLFIDQHQLGTLWADNFQVRLRPGLRRVPDIIFILSTTELKITNTEIEGAPDLVVEIVSHESLEQDWRDKYFEYEQAGVKEYWTIDPYAEKMAIYCLNEQGKYESQKAEQKIMHSKVLPGFWIKPEWLWQEPLPNVIEIARELRINI